MASALSYPDIIALKRDKKELSKDDIEFFIKGVVTKKAGKEQVGEFSFLLLILNSRL
jgi:thymidine phosphorylase